MTESGGFVFRTKEQLINLLIGAWIVALVSMAGSLFFSEVMKFMPCVLCWYQRIAMYPLFLFFLIAIVKKDLTIIPYTLALAAIGWIVAAYHNLLHWGVIPETMSPCVQGVPCSTVYINWLGFITIPFLSLIAFSIILLLLYWIQSVNRSETIHE